jgi:hypothetical protein
MCSRRLLIPQQRKTHALKNQFDWERIVFPHEKARECGLKEAIFANLGRLIVTPITWGCLRRD